MWGKIIFKHDFYVRLCLDSDMHNNPKRKGRRKCAKMFLLPKHEELIGFLARGNLKQLLVS